MHPGSQPSLALLLTYFRWADELSGRIRDLPPDDHALAEIYVRNWLGAVSALLEGWKAVGPPHPVVSRLLAEGKPAGQDRAFEDLLRAVRADVFEFSDGNPHGTEAFLRTPGAIDWAHDLHLAFRAFFDEKQGVKQRG